MLWSGHTRAQRGGTALEHGGGDGHAEETAELGGISAERCWREEVGGRGPPTRVGESLPIVQNTPAHCRGDGMVLWNIRVPGVCMVIFLVWFGRQSTDRVTGSVATCCSL